MSVISLPSAARHASTLAVAADGEIVHVVSIDDAAWWTARLEMLGGGARVRVSLQSALCESVRRTGRVRVVVYRDGAGVEQPCVARVLDDDRLGTFAALALTAEGEPVPIVANEGEPPRT